MGSSTISALVQETCEVIWDTLQPLEMKPPSSSQRWKKIAVNFYKRTKFPNCIGACDGKHIRLISPLHSVSLYCNYKKYNSIVLMAIVDADYCFTAINVGSYGKESDSSIFKNWTFAKKLRENRLNLPEDQPLPGIDTSPMPYVFVGDEAFPISNNFLRL
uniref:DDE Tnp4 domain-containing protein n=1 Tax=Pectinophora gossypiella TaxID=13191 RepID=A0A1E1WJG3_PECGO